MPEFSQIPPLSLYIHFPWCIRKCPYCDFNSHAIRENAFPEEAYLDALLADLDQEIPRIKHREVMSIFMGGGTPSLFSDSGINRLLAAISKRVALSGDCEITLEANPGSVEAGRFQGFRDAGVNRLSIGVQSFADDQLCKLGRVHDSQAASAAIEQAQAAGFDNINLDLMFALPRQAPEQALEDLRRALVFNTSHLSWYQLTIEPNTQFYSSPPALPDSDTSWHMQELGTAFLHIGGLTQYEVSAYAHNGRQCRHNLNYWQFGDYLGLGAGAHGKITDPAGGKITRYIRHRIPERYMKLAGNTGVIIETRELSVDDIRLEFMMNALRLNDGVCIELFESRTGLSIKQIAGEIEKAVARRLLVDDPERIMATPSGRQYLNELLELFMDDSPGPARGRYQPHQKHQE